MAVRRILLSLRAVFALFCGMALFAFARCRRRHRSSSLTWTGWSITSSDWGIAPSCSAGGAVGLVA